MTPKAGLMLLLALSVLLPGCATDLFSNKPQKLETTLNAYSANVRWGDLAALYDFLEPELAMQAVIPDNLENIRVTQYERLAAPVISGDRAVTTARISYVHEDRQVVRSVVDRQEWRYDSALGWRRSNPIPDLP